MADSNGQQFQNAPAKQQPNANSAPKSFRTPTSVGPESQPFQSYKRKKRRKAAWIIFAISGTGVAILSILAFLGQVSGTFTVKLNQVEAHLGLSSDDTFPTQTSYLTTPGLPSGYNFSCDKLPTIEEMDSNTGGDKSNNILDKDGNVVYQNYMGTTFFLKNFSADTTAYHVTLNIDDYRTPSNQAASILESLRVRVFENIYTGTTETHSYETYALEASTAYWFTKADGTEETRETIGAFTTASDGTRTPAAKRAENNAFATNFESNSVVFGRDYPALEANTEVRYSVFIWIEGDDKQCASVQPLNSSVTLSMHFATI
jgi:hypothetical protein